MFNEFVDISTLPTGNWEERLDSHSAIHRELELQASELFQLGKAFSITGNLIVSDQLYETGKVLREISKKLSQLQGSESSERLREAQQGVATVLTACLDACEKKK